ncbi:MULTISPECIES: RNA polymerase sigma factor [unclassified Spirosoma]|uniref:RNA polymerase sigma factor n=1 Tax=unclassified Spirosoma TaxID=2621999 RepID=UPI000959C4B7|nr:MULTISPECIES: RNA polymerase sigma factor [unclassified Spirosoma]MBN8822864.1 RNA polymerase sigma factor [Spirosoma sp.]OJW80058.1 MAG: RNA polymerase subunit sigma-70 [Spirosoma sp. 48-14]
MLRLIPFFTTEAQLVAALKRGESRAHKVVYERYAGKMLAVCTRYCANRDDAEEVMIDGFMRVFEKIEQFREDGSFEGWIRRVMVTESLMFLRKNKQWRQEVSIDDVTVEPDYAWADTAVNENDLLRMVNQLPDGYRTVFNLYAIEGYSHAEIAEMLGISEGTSKSQLSRARMLLQANIKKLEQDSAQGKWAGQREYYEKSVGKAANR